MRRQDIGLRQVSALIHDVDVRRVRVDDLDSDFRLWVEVIQYLNDSGDDVRMCLEWIVTVEDRAKVTVAALERRINAVLECALEDNPYWWMGEIEDLKRQFEMKLSYQGIEHTR